MVERKWFARIGVLAAVLVVGAAIPVLRIRPVADEPPAPTTVAPTTPTLGQGGPIVYDVAFYDPAHGYALRGTCKPSCTNELLYTDNGRQWHPRAIPDPDEPTGTGPSRTLYVLGADRIAVEHASSRWYSEDGGQTWREVPVDPGPAVPVIPEGAVLERRCNPPGSGCQYRDGLAVILPDSGRSATLVNPPPLRGLRPGRFPAGDGGWWIAGIDSATGGWALAVSRDAGRSWSVGPLPRFAGDSFAGLSVTATPAVVYVTAVGSLPGVKNGLLAIFRSTDGGRTWEQTWRAAADREPRTLNGVAVARTDGLIVVTDANEGYGSSDGGRTFRLLEGTYGAVQWQRGGYLATVAGSANTYLGSPDGAVWTQFLVG